MFREIPNLKDSNKNSVKDTHSLLTPYETGGFRLGSYTKTNKLIAGLYMVTDILDKDEPIRARLRVLGSGLITDIFSFPFSAKKLNNKIAEIMSFLDIASTVGIISQMNASILKKEFLLLQESIEESIPHPTTFSGKESLAEFMKDDGATSSIHSNINSIGQVKMNRIGVQKGHTLLKALKDMSDRVPAPYQTGGFGSGSDTKHSHITGEKFDSLKKERREEIIRIIRKNQGGATITDIRTQATGALASCGEKTLQRDLISMLKDSVLNKTGEKRWSRYFVAN